jgi:HEAT repeat protein
LFDPTPEQPTVDPDTAGDVKQPPDETTRVPSPQAKLLAQLAEPATRDAAVADIREQGSAAVPDLIAGLDDPDWQVRAGAAFGLSILGKEAAEALPKLRAMARFEQHESPRDAAAWAIDAIEPSD